MASVELDGPGELDEPDPVTHVVTPPTKHFLLQPPGEDNGNVLPGAVLLNSKTFDDDKDLNVPQKRDDNVLPGAIGLAGAFDESGPINIMGGNVTEGTKPAEGKPGPDGQAEKPKDSATVEKDIRTDLPTKESEEKTGKQKKGKRRKKKGKKKAKKKKASGDTPTAVNGNKPTTNEGDAADTSKLGTKTNKKHADDRKEDLSKGADSVPDKDSKDGNAKPQDNASSDDSPGALYAGPHAMNRQMTELQVPGEPAELDEAAVKSHYEKLVKAYLAPFSEGIKRQSFFKILKRRTYALAPPGSNKGIQTLLFQLHDKSTYYHPHFRHQS